MSSYLSLVPIRSLGRYPAKGFAIKKENWLLYDDDPNETTEFTFKGKLFINSFEISEAIADDVGDEFLYFSFIDIDAEHNGGNPFFRTDLLGEHMPCIELWKRDPETGDWKLVKRAGRDYNIYITAPAFPRSLIVHKCDEDLLHDQAVEQIFFSPLWKGLPTYARIKRGLFGLAQLHPDPYVKDTFRGLPDGQRQGLMTRDGDYVTMKIPYHVAKERIESICDNRKDVVGCESATDRSIWMMGVTLDRSLLEVNLFATSLFLSSYDHDPTEELAEVFVVYGAFPRNHVYEFPSAAAATATATAVRQPAEDEWETAPLLV